ncbi:MAG: TraR/DksA family transcriptional regulator [Victivallaceae bacterium]|nr:TraR/DksA family transcriptional regulator [Victivallaceae bacterium]
MAEKSKSVGTRAAANATAKKCAAKKSGKPVEKAAPAVTTKPKKPVIALTGKDKHYYDALMHVRDVVMGQMQYHAEDALDCSNADKRGVTTHMADISSDNSRHEMELRMLTEEGNILELIEDALERLMHGEYGNCLDCGKPISEGRLEIRPYAIYCVKCKSLHEKNMH